MKSDMQLKTMVNHMVQLRVYDDDMSILIRLKMIEELNMQIKNILIDKFMIYGFCKAKQLGKKRYISLIDARRIGLMLMDEWIEKVLK